MKNGEVRTFWGGAAKNGIGGFSDEELRKFRVRILFVDGNILLFTLLVKQCFRLSDGGLSLSPLSGGRWTP